jgi:hypothetical protein
MSAQQTDTVSLGTCPTCGGPAQFIGDAPAADGHTWHGVTVREVRLPNVDEDLGGGWRLLELFNHGLRNPPQKRWDARATKDWRDQVEAFGETPSAAYLALRSAIEARS